MLKQYYQRGITLLELMFSLVIVLMVLVVAARYYETVRTAHRVNEAVSMVHVIYTASEGWLQNNLDLSEASMQNFVNNNSVPNNFVTSNNVNPWGGDIKIAIDKSKPMVINITMSNVPLNDCRNLLQKLRQKMTDVIPSVSAGGSCENNAFAVPLDFSAK
ncbi:MAG: type 4 pilus major pilin [Gammaproteobacteria bacterium]